MSFLHVKLPILCIMYAAIDNSNLYIVIYIRRNHKVYITLMTCVMSHEFLCEKKPLCPVVSCICRISLITSLELRSNRSNCGSGFLFVGIQMLHIRSYMGSCTSDFLENVKRNLDQEKTKILETFKRQLLEKDGVFCNLDDTWDDLTKCWSLLAHPSASLYSPVCFPMSLGGRFAESGRSMEIKFCSPCSCCSGC